MEIVRENIDALNAVLKCVLKKEDYQPKVEDAIKKYSKKVDMKGFRKGLVPVGMVKKMYGNAILAEEINTMIQDSLYKYLEENKIDILGQPLPQDNQQVSFEINDPRTYEFSYEIGLAPEVQLTYLDSKPVYEQYAITIDEKMLDEEVDNLRNRYGKRTNPDDVADNDIIYVELKELNADGTVKEGGLENSTSFNTNILKAGAAKDEVLKIKKGDSFNLNVFDSFDRDKENVGKYILNAQPEQLDTMSGLFKMTLSNISRLEPAELNDEFFNALYTEGDVKSEADMREKIRKDLVNYFSTQTERKVLQKLGRDLIDNTNLNLPDTFLKKWIRVSNEKPVTEEQVDNDYPHFVKELKWNLIVAKVAKENNLQVEYAEILQRTREIVQNQLLQYGMGYLPDEQLDNFGQRFLKDKRHMQKTQETLLEEKVLHKLKEGINIQDMPVSLEDYNAMMAKETHEHDHNHDHDHDHEH